MKTKLRKLNKKYDNLVKKAMSADLSEVEYDKTIEQIQSLGIEIYKLQISKSALPFKTK